MEEKMTKRIPRKDHIIFASANDIIEICKPLNKLGITSFNFVRTYEDGSQINLANTPQWLNYFYEKEFYHIGAFERHPSKYQSGYALWPQLSGQQIFLMLERILISIMELLLLIRKLIAVLFIILAPLKTIII